jgi:hypothetical protein
MMELLCWSLGVICRVFKSSFRFQAIQLRAVALVAIEAKPASVLWLTNRASHEEIGSMKAAINRSATCLHSHRQMRRYAIEAYLC